MEDGTRTWPDLFKGKGFCAEQLKFSMLKGRKAPESFRKLFGETLYRAQL